jgi:outer membrane autotransporter protein
VATAIESDGINATITNSGSISATSESLGNRAEGIDLDGDGATIINNGSISATSAADAAFGIDSSAGNATITNNGSISAISEGLGNDAEGIDIDGVNATIFNNGIILASSAGDDAFGINSDGDNATITNTGSISATSQADDAVGISSSGGIGIITNTGRILATSAGDDAFGIDSDGDNATITSTGSISVTSSGDGAFGIDSSGANASIANSGNISVISEIGGDDAFAIDSSGDNAIINNSGSILAISTVDFAIGINSSGDNAIIINSGLISATDYAVRGGANNIMLNLLPGSQIIGRIDLGGGADNDTANIYGGVSANLTFENTENINLFGAGVVTGNNVITVDITVESTRGVALAALEVSTSLLHSERQPMAWAQLFGGTFNRDPEGDALGFDYDHAGVNFGYEWDVTETRFGLMGGFVNSYTDTKTASFNSKANTFFVGAYGNLKFGGVSMTGSLIAGLSDTDNERRVIDNLNGIETATSDFDSFFISPNVTLASAYTLTDHWEFRPSTHLSYSMAWLDGYSETGTTNSNLTVDDRTAKALSVRAQLAAAYLISARSGLELRLRLNSRNTDDDDTNVSIAGSQFKFASAGDENVTGGFAGASFRIFNQNNLTLVADLEVSGNSNEDYVAGSIALEYIF